ncbi:MAG: hypothetical protein KDA27_13090 [Candidatus Eisenbacteria bacterium]|uniref:FlgD Ig-like domain-containing protein n=1 Tax=Eiseniibacteriota bacterium TaxID=2212470 RepID=A0A956ND32_UNCEI|nr:hypothetical protein [Candidatus Eisenbacteria bacterium]MCB9463450.1 hypothetical protein [Candidatus Eisenbacteria bacterium]
MLRKVDHRAVRVALASLAFAVLTFSLLPTATAVCDGTDGHVKWLSGIDYTHYPPFGEGSYDAFNLATEARGYVLGATDGWVYSFAVGGPGSLVQIDQALGTQYSDLIVDGAYAYAVGSSELGVYFVGTDGSIDAVGSALLGFVGKLAKSGDFLYITQSTGVLVVDVSDPSDPTVVGSLTVDAQSVAVSGSYLYIGDYISAIDVYDVSAPASPVFVTQVSGLPGEVKRLAVRGNTLFATTNPGGIVSFDVSTPEAPQQLDFLDTGSAGNIEVCGDQLGVNVNGLLVWVDATDPSQLERRGAFPDASLGGAAFFDGVAYVAGGSRLQALQLNSGTNAAPLVASPEWAGARDLHAFDVGPDEFLALRFPSALKILLVTDPWAPVEVASLTFATTRALAVANGHAYLSRQGGFDVVDLSDPYDPVVVGSVSGSFGSQVIPTGSRVYTVDDIELTTLDVSDPSSPNVLGIAELPTFSLEGITTANGMDVYFTDEFEGNITLFRYDVSDPENPAYRADAPIYGIDRPGAMLVADGSLFLGGRTFLTRRNASDLSLVDEEGASAFASGGLYAGPGGSLYSWGGGFHSFDVSSGVEYEFGGVPPAGGGVLGVAGAGELVYVSDNEALYVFGRPCAPAALPDAVGIPGNVLRLRSVPNPAFGPVRLTLEGASAEGASAVASSSSSDYTPTIIEILAPDGRLLRRLTTEDPAGRSVSWDGRDAAGRDVPSGIVYVRWSGALGTATGSVRIVR